LGRIPQFLADEIGRLHTAYDVDEFFLWHHVGYFPQEVEMAMLAEFAAAVIAPNMPPRGDGEPTLASGAR